MVSAPNDVVGAIREQNVQVAAGQIGEPPTPDTQPFQLTVSTTGRLPDATAFENIIVKTDDEGKFVYVKDIGRVELGAQNYKTCRACSMARPLLP